MYRGKNRWRINYPCKDGYVTFFLFLGQMGKRTRALVKWMDEEGMAGDLKTVNWEKCDTNTVDPEEAEAWMETVARFFLTHTKAELYEKAVKRNLTLVPCTRQADLLSDGQLSARNFWVEVEHPELQNTITYPGHPFGPGCSFWQISRRAPKLGEHNEEIYRNELGFSSEELVILKGANVI